jgi:hypothetical protein
MKPLPPLVVAVVVAAALTGCGGASREQDVAAASGGAASPGQTVCADVVRPTPLPTAFPREVPLPPKAVLTGTEERSGGRLIVVAVASGTFRDTLGFMQRAYPAAGLALEDGEVESGDAESDFTGRGLTGRWTLRELPGCHGDTLVTVLVAKG